MKKLVLFVTAIGIALMTCVVPTFAASYDLPDPTLVKDFGAFVWQRFFYVYDEDSSSYEPETSSWSYPDFGSRFYSLWDGRNDSSAYDWALGDEWVPHDEIVNNQTDLTFLTDNTNVLLTRIWGKSLRNTITVPTYVQTGIYLPSDGQYLKISFSVTGFDRLNLPSSSETDIYNYNNLFLLYSSGGTSGRGTTLSPSTVVTTVSGRCTYYDVYFDYTDSAFTGNLDTGSTLSLAIRLPYSVAADNYYDDPNLLIGYDFDYPRTYEILTVGGYEQQLDQIQDAIISSNESLLEFYEQLPEEDVAYIQQLDQENNKLDDAVGDYSDAQAGIQDIVGDITLRPLRGQVDHILAPELESELGISDISTNTLLWNDLLTGMVSVAFGFGIISLFLFGLRKG